MDREAAYGAIWRRMAAKEGHMKALPPVPEAPRHDPLHAKVLELSAQGLSRVQVAAALGMSAPRVSQIITHARRGDHLATGAQQ